MTPSSSFSLLSSSWNWNQTRTDDSPSSKKPFATFCLLTSSSDCHFEGLSCRQQPERLLTTTAATTTTTTTTQDEEETDHDIMTPDTKQMADLILSLAARRRNQRIMNKHKNHQDDNNNTSVSDANHTTNNNTNTTKTQQQQRQIYQERRALAKAITLLESQAPARQAQANAMLLYLQREQQQNNQQQQQQESSSLPSSFCIGIAGAPGAGKSTLIEAFGKYLLGLEEEQQQQQEQHDNDNNNHLIIPHQLAVVCVDPSSVLQGGSILGDKTRMPELSAAHDRAYVRPAPSRRTLGGLAGQRTYDTLWLLRQVYDVLLLETVGLGQSEVEIAQCVDLVVLCVPPGGGDSLQGVKKGILEVTDLVCVTKADGNLEAAARATAADYQGALQFTDSTMRMMREERNRSNNDSENEDCLAKSDPAAEQRRQVVLTSAETGRGLPQLWKSLCSVRHHQLESGQWLVKEEAQHDYWMWKSFQTLVQNHVLKEFGDKKDHEHNNATLQTRPPARVAAARLLQKLVGGKNNNNDSSLLPPK